MSEANGNGKDLIRVVLVNGAMEVKFDTTVNVALISHAVALVNANLSNFINSQIVVKQKEANNLSKLFAPMSKIVMPKNILDNMGR